MKKARGIVIISVLSLSIQMNVFAMEPADTNTFIECTAIDYLENDSAYQADLAEEIQAVQFAVSRQGYPYSMAERDSGKAYDCSSLVYYSYKKAGVDISNGGATSAAEIARGLSVSGREVSGENLKPGDLIFYSYKRNGRYQNISHVSMYIGNGMQIEASYGKQKVTTRPVSLSSSVMVGRPSYD